MSLDLITTIVVAALSGGAGKVVAAPLEGVADAVKNRVRTRLEKTIAKANAKSHGAPLQVNDRVAAKVLNEAAWVDEEITADYLGGVLAASGPDDDAGAAIVAQIGRLSALQLRFHYVVYREVRRLWPDPSVNLYLTDEADRVGIRLSIADLVTAFGGPNVIKLPSVAATLAHEGLIADHWQMTSADPNQQFETFTAEITPTALGAELFLWGHGSNRIHASVLLDRAASLEFLTDVPPTPGVALLTAPVEHD